MTYLVTGATGFIGTNIIEQLATTTSAAIVALSNTQPTARQVLLAKRAGGELKFVQGDVRDQARLEQVMKDNNVTQVIHAAAVTSNAERERTAAPFVVDVNLVGAAAVASASANRRVQRLVLVGSAGVFSTHYMPDGAVATEEQPHQVDTLYGVGKSAAETIVRRIAKLNDLDVVIGRIATAFGPWEHDTGYRDTLSPIYQLTKIARSGGVARLARDKKSNWHYSRDAAGALLRLADTPEAKFADYNLGPGWAWPLSAWCERLASCHADFRYEIGAAPNVELYGDNDGGLLSGARYLDEFGPTAHYDIDLAFADFMSWLEGEPCTQ